MHDNITSNHNSASKLSPIKEGYLKLVDALITPENADREAMAFIELVMTTANVEDDAIGPIAHAAARHAFMKTEAFERAFREFVGWPELAANTGGSSK